MLPRTAALLLLTINLGFSQSPLLRLRTEGPRGTLELSSDLSSWVVQTNLDLSMPAGFFRTQAKLTLPFSFLYEARELRSIPFSNEYYFTFASERLPDTWAVQDQSGVRMWRASDGKIYNHPVLQAEYGLAMFNGYLNTTNTAYLVACEKHANRLIETAVESRGGWYYPYRYAWQLAPWPGNDVLQPPWFSAMAQGMALSLFVHLYELTHKEVHLEAANRTFVTFKLENVADEPWIVEVDEEGFLWFEEYAKNVTNPQYVYNGHIFALFGLYRFQQLTGDADAKRLVEAGLTTVKRWHEFFRTADWVVKYSRRHPVFNKNYQNALIRQLNVLFSMTGDVFFAKAAEQLADDYPDYGITPKGTMNGAVAGYQFDAFGAITNKRSFLFAGPVTVNLGARRTVVEQPGTWLRVDSGELAGFWVKEFYPDIVMNCVFEPLYFSIPRKLSLRSGAPSYSFVKYDQGSGAAVETITRTFFANEAMQSVEAKFDARAIINSRLHVRVAEGEFAGYWTPVTARVALE